MNDLPIKRALLSVSDKTGLLEFAQFLQTQGVELLSTGGTATMLRQAGLKVTEVSEATGFPEIMNGRVKTLHPTIHGGILARRDMQSHLEAMQAHRIQAIDLVVINLYPFEETVARGADFDTCIENIDIGGPSLIRGAAKNHAFVTVVVDPADYARVQAEMQSGATTAKTRRELAAKAYGRTAAYDAAISGWFAGQTGEAFPPYLTFGGTLKAKLHYGENPHQAGAYYAIDEAGPSLATARQTQGAALSYNNYNDASAAFELACEFDEPAVVIVKHANPCGVALGADLAEAYAKAFACDTISAYGGIIAVNRPLDMAFVQAMGKLFVEVLIAPEAPAKVLEALAAKKKMKILLTGPLAKASGKRLQMKSISGGFLYQQEDGATLDESGLKTVTQRFPSQTEMADLKFAFTLAKHVKSNAIVLVKDRASIGIGAGQMSRIDSTRLACQKAESMGLNPRGAVLASDAFFPFADNVELAAENGIAAVIQPGGSIRDEEIVAAADKAGLAMVFTGIRHFRH